MPVPVPPVPARGVAVPGVIRSLPVRLVRPLPVPGVPVPSLAVRPLLVQVL
ncbi:hypothetical protein [Candidatus Protofrankia californiensis]|uniref:hypothetical protein n=1 Tax=Candidatus Protofrankia californiensis TaxID=1839754 RepID=UPI0013ED00BF|nr:hypothetical protein [Candidatus Protofrankia californiensis]